MPSLLIVADSLGGGLGAVALEHAAWFRRLGWRVTVAAPESSARAAEAVRVPLPRTARDLPGLVRAGVAIRRLRKSVSADIVHCHGARSFAAALLGGVRAFVTLHGHGAIPSDPALYPLIRRIGLRVVARLAIGAISATPDVVGAWRFVPHASPRLQRLRPKPLPTDRTPTFLWLGRLAEQKRPDLFVEAVARVARMRPIRGVMAGDGPLRREVEELVARTGAPVELVGHREDVEDLLDSAWAVVLFSRWEGLPFAVEEAMWVGRPVIGSDIPALRYLVGDAGVLVPNRVEEASQAIAALCDGALARELAERARDRIRQLLTPDSPWPEVESLYRGLMNSGRG